MRRKNSCYDTKQVCEKKRGAMMMRGRGDSSRRSESVEASTTERGDQQTNETLLQRLERTRGENTVKENQRANETSEEKQRRMLKERMRFRREYRRFIHSEEGHYGYEYFSLQWKSDYIKREREKRGIEEENYLYLEGDQIAEYCKPFLEAEIITTGMQKTTLNEMTSDMRDDIDFKRRILDLNRVPPNRASDSWKKFCDDQYYSIVDRYNLDFKGSLMLSDIMTIGQKNISSPEQLNSEEYKKILNITLNEWESWKHNNNIIDFVTIHQQGRTHLTGGEPAGTA
jgi:hypothetical protein